MTVLAQNRLTGAPVELGADPSPLLTVRLLRAIARFAESHAWIAFSLVSFFCLWGSLDQLVSRHLDHDEIFTFYIAQAPTLGQLFRLTHTVDLHPPLTYLLVRGSFALFGASSWSCRIPSLLAYFLTTALLFWFLRQRLSVFYGLIAVLFLWSVPLARHATIARPYALVLFFTSVMLVSWHRAISYDGTHSRRWILAALTVGAFGLLLSHVLAALPFAVFCAAEFVRFCLRRKPDWRLWAALAVPVCSVLTYLPLLRTHSTILFADEYHVTPLRVFNLYWESVRYIATPLAAIALLAIFWPYLQRRRVQTPSQLKSAVDLPLGFVLASLAVVPLVIAGVFARTGTVFFDRYGMVWLVPLALVPALLLGDRTRCNQAAAGGVTALSAALLFLNTSGKMWLVEVVSNLPPKVARLALYLVALSPIYVPRDVPPLAYLRPGLAAVPMVKNLNTVEPELPMVAHTGLTFMELDQRESVAFTQRLYLLTDEQAAATIAHDTVFAHYEVLKDVFPIRGKIEPYCSFVAGHPHFVVVGDYQNSQGWLLRKLDADGAKLKPIGRCGGTTEECQLFDVTLPSAPCR